MEENPMMEANRLNRDWCDRMLNELTACIECVKVLIRAHAGTVPDGLHSARLGLLGTRTSLRNQMENQGWNRETGEWAKLDGVGP